MQFTLFFVPVAAALLPGVLVAPSTTSIPQDKGITLKLTEGGVIQRVAADGTILGTSHMTDGEMEKFMALASRSQSQRRDNVFVPRACLLGHPCDADSICWFNGCDGCLFWTTNSGGCYGSIA